MRGSNAKGRLLYAPVLLTVIIFLFAGCFPNPVKGDLPGANPNNRPAVQSGADPSNQPMLPGGKPTGRPVAQSSGKPDSQPAATVGKSVGKIVFNEEIPDPQAAKMNLDGGGTAVTGKASIDLVLWEVSPGIYEGSGGMNREIGQEVKELGLSTKITTQYSLGKIQMKTDGGKAQGTVPARARIIDDKVAPTALLSMHLNKTAGIYAEYPYTLAVDGDKAKLTVTINPMAVLSFEGTVAEGVPEAPAAAEPVTAAAETDWLIYVNDMYSVPIDQNAEAQYWITLAARKSGGKDAYGTYCGKLYTAALEGGRLPAAKGSADGSKNADYLGEVEFDLTPFDAGLYESNGGYDTEGQGYTALAILNAKLDGRGKKGALDRGGLVPVLITLRGDEVGVELPAGKMKDSLKGTLLYSGDLAARQRDAEDTIYLNRLITGYYENPQNPDYSEMPDMSQYAMPPSELQTAGSYISLWGTADGFPSWYPADWIPKISPFDYIVQQPFFGGFNGLCSVQYFEKQHLPEVWPVYKQVISRYPGYLEKESLDTEAECDTLFKIGKYTVNVNLQDCVAGTRVWVTIQE